MYKYVKYQKINTQKYYQDRIMQKEISIIEVMRIVQRNTAFINST